MKRMDNLKMGSGIAKISSVTYICNYGLTDFQPGLVVCNRSNRYTLGVQIIDGGK